MTGTRTRTRTGTGTSAIPGRSGPQASKRVCLLGAAGTIGRATSAALVRRGYEVVCFVRPPAIASGASVPTIPSNVLEGASVRFVDVSDPVSLDRDGFSSSGFDAVIFCMASRAGAPKDAWAIDYRAQLNFLEAAQRAGVDHFVLLSAICVQKPLLAFQQAKLAFEAALIASGLRYSIVRPTAFFKSLSGQIDRVRNGRPFLIFGDGILTSCKPISDGDLGDFLVSCLEDARLLNCVLPIGGPGEAITPRQQGEALFELLGRQPKFRSVPIALLDGIIGGLSTLGLVAPSLREKAELHGSAATTQPNPCLCSIRRQGCTMQKPRLRQGTRLCSTFTARLWPAATCLTEATMPSFRLL